jgi:hypothetical protein
MRKISDIKKVLEYLLSSSLNIFKAKNHSKRIDNFKDIRYQITLIHEEEIDTIIRFYCKNNIRSLPCFSSNSG